VKIEFNTTLVVILDYSSQLVYTHRNILSYTDWGDTGQHEKVVSTYLGL